MPRMKTTPHIQRIPATMAPTDLLAWRKSHGLSQEDASNLLGMARRPYQYLEQGKTQAGMRLPKIPRLIELATKGLDMELRVIRMKLGTRSLAEIKASEG
jgi:transcriptional regulator with XRE-family HTH domain